MESRIMKTSEVTEREKQEIALRGKHVFLCSGLRHRQPTSNVKIHQKELDAKWRGKPLNLCDDIGTLSRATMTRL